jgi:hypothetical protein
MLTYSPPLPLTIYYWGNHRNITAEDEEGILLALQHYDRVRHIRLSLPVSSLQKVITTLGEQFPILERMHIMSRTSDDTGLVLPRSFQAPLIRRISLQTVALPIRSPLLLTAVGLVTLALDRIPSSAYFPPSYLLTRLPLMHQLEKLVIQFHSPLPSRNVEPQLSSTPATSHLTLPNLRFFFLRGVSTWKAFLLGSTPLASAISKSFLSISSPSPHASRSSYTRQGTSTYVRFGLTSVALDLL